jgi:hypothetical protein
LAGQSFEVLRVAGSLDLDAGCGGLDFVEVGDGQFDVDGPEVLVESAMIRSAPSCFADRTPSRPTAPSHNRDGRAGPDTGGDGGEPARAQNIGGGQEASQQPVVGHLRGGDQGAVGERDTQRFDLRAARANVLAVLAGGLVAGPAVRASVVGGEEAADDELARPDGRDVAADLLDDAAILVSG